MENPVQPPLWRFGAFELDSAMGELRKQRHVVRLAPQPLKLLVLLVSRAGEIVSRDEVRQALWGSDTFVDFDQAVNSSIRQIRAALGDDAEHPMYVETVPRRGYRFIAPLDREPQAAVPPGGRRTGTEMRLQKALWANIAELRLTAVRSRQRRRIVTRIVVVLAALAALALAYLATL